MSASHSQNAALFSAESGGMMLSYSPSQGVYKPGQMIYGGRSEWATSPIVAPIDQNDHGKVETELKARPWSESTDPHSNSNRPGRGRSLSEGYLARQGTLLNPNSSTHRAGQELGVLLGKSKRLSTGKLLPVEGEVSEKIRLEAAKKGKARVEVGVILERECLVEGGEVRGRLEVKVRGGKRGEGVRVGGGKVRVVGFEGENFFLFGTSGSLLTPYRRVAKFTTYLLSPSTSFTPVRQPTNTQWSDFDTTALRT